MLYSVVLILFDKPDETSLVIDAILRAKDIEMYDLVVVLQEGNEEVGALVSNIRFNNLHIIRTTKNRVWSVKQAINYNVYAGMKFAFDTLGSKGAVLIEDDVVVAYDAIHFVKYILERYKDDSSFFGVNLFSREPCNLENKFSYGKYRYGLGKGWAINDKIWRYMQTFWNGQENQHWDALIETRAKRNYVIMPYCSRVLDIGWNNGCHTPNDKNNEYYTTLKDSFVDTNELTLKKYVYDNELDFSWREDCVKYNENQYLKYYLIDMKIRIVHWLKNSVLG